MYRKDEPASALLLVHERSTATGTHPFNMGRLVMLLVLGSGVFIVVRTCLSPSPPAWLMPTRPVAPDDVATMLMIVGIFEWLTLIAVTILPMSAIAVILDRIWLKRRLAGARADAARKVYDGIALLGLLAAVALWSVAWDSIVVPFRNSVAGAVVLGLLIGAVALYTLKADRASD